MRFHFSVYITLCLSWSSIEAAEYKYPYHDPYLATATTAIFCDDGPTPRLESKIVHVPGLPGRNQLPSLAGRGDVSIALYRQSHPAPLIFILAGIGSNPYFGVGPYLASLFYREGFHIVILASPMSWNFALAASRSGVPDYVPADARDLYEVMQKCLSTLRDRYDVKITAINFMGVSLGALEGAYLSVIDAVERKIDIGNYLLVNPPVDLSYAHKKLDEWGALRETFGRDKSEDIVAKAVAIVQSFSKESILLKNPKNASTRLSMNGKFPMLSTAPPFVLRLSKDERRVFQQNQESRDDPAVFDRLAKKFASFTTEELQFLIAGYLQTQLPELVYVTQVIYDQGVLTAPKNEVRRRLEEAKKFTFTDYNEKIAVPLWKRRATETKVDLESLIERGSLARILDRLRNNSKVHIMHNADDFLAERKSIEELKTALGEQVRLYPYGGHLGNVWFPENKEYALSLFRPVR